MEMAENVGRSAVGQFIRVYEELKDDSRFQDSPELIPFAAAMRVVVESTERLSHRTEIECKKEIYYALGKPVPSDDQLLKRT